MFRFGFELEGFYIEDEQIAPPPLRYPSDGFPGLIELRTIGAKSLYAAYAEILTKLIEYPGDFQRHEGTFTPRQRALLRRRHEYKSAWDIQNIYGKNPRALGNKTIASLQINISREKAPEFWDKDKQSITPARYGVFDTAKIVRALDEQFRIDILDARRQPGEYAIKDDRLEYRSLPNFCFPLEINKAKEFLDKIENAINIE